MTKADILKERVFKLLLTKPYSSNRNHINRLFEQIRYLERSTLTVDEH